MWILEWRRHSGFLCPGIPHNRFIVQDAQTGIVARSQDEASGEGTDRPLRLYFHFLEHPTDRNTEHHFCLDTQVYHIGVKIILSFR